MLKLTERHTQMLRMLHADRSGMTSKEIGERLAHKSAQQTNGLLCFLEKEGFVKRIYRINNEPNSWKHRCEWFISTHGICQMSRLLEGNDIKAAATMQKLPRQRASFFVGVYCSPRFASPRLDADDHMQYQSRGVRC